ncbi:Oidioi.mRNA.OKI2018_I69.PAR.g10227.t1.cds [Oikopleura dioica]|uniref:Oidioi.mRNA.OKI2018_I69.PAR.g10227.t1.cds n=1 Tax=Oikopleura dioica TaxID=34765 RepID=A0ABN7RQK6_OIKDI|nr:Oidioi.mRNA.OKI2018_I69.PAR.g10227.t1.cds [Oikopleura dioica]
MGKIMEECSTCGKKFRAGRDMARHQMIHSGEKPFACDICGHAFREKYRMLQHRGNKGCKARAKEQKMLAANEDENVVAEMTEEDPGHVPVPMNVDQSSPAEDLDEEEEPAENAENEAGAASPATGVKNGIWISGVPNGVQADSIKKILVDNGVKGLFLELKVALHVKTQQSFAYIELEDKRDHKLALKTGTVLINNKDFAQVAEDIDQLNSDVDGLKVNHCSSNNCHNGATCISGNTGFSCQCAHGWTGSTCQDDYNECTDHGVYTCLNGGTCFNSKPPERFSCTCPAEFYGTHCESKHDDCPKGDECGPHGFCVDGVRTHPGTAKYSCICQKGFEYDENKKTCENIDECATGAHLCYPGVDCIDNIGSYSCGACPTGMAGNGVACESVDYCSINNGGCSQNPKVSCRKSSTGTSCGECPNGYEGDGRFCRKHSACDSNPCSPFATCTDNNGEFSCKCGHGYSGNGIGPDGCKADGPGPDPIDCNLECNNGVCLIQNGSPVCICYQGWAGTHCDERGDPCKPNPCFHNAECETINGGTDFRCTCPDDWTGKICNLPAGQCGGDIEESSGVIDYPTGIDYYSPNTKCIWSIVVDGGFGISMDFSKFDLPPKHGSTCFTYVELIDGDEEENAIKYCGNIIPQVNNTYTNRLQVVFAADSSNNNQYTGFTMSWVQEETKCGGVIRVNGPAQLSLPVYPQPYNPFIECVWVFEADPQEKLQLTFTNIDLYSGRCEDQVEVYDGLQTETRLGQICNTTSDATLSTETPIAYVIFSTSGMNSFNKGFELGLVPMPTENECGENLEEDAGVLMSVNYPDPGYGADEYCFWSITVGMHDHVGFTFDEIDMEDSYSYGCKWDSLKVFKGFDHKGDPEQIVFCGYHKADFNDAICENKTCRELPGTIVSHKNTMVIEFKSDRSNHGKGFKGSWETTCGGSYFTETYISSPYFPNTIPFAKMCSYYITAPENQIIQLNFEVFALSLDSYCPGKSSLTIHDGPNGGSPQLGYLCGNEIPETIFSSGRNIFMMFNHIPSEDDHGFLLKTTFDYEGCGQTFTGDSGFIRSPGYPQPYPHNLDCVYFIRGDSGNLIELEFIYLKLEGYSTCTDYLAIWDAPVVGNTTDDPTFLGKFCRDPPDMIHSSSEYLTMKFHTDFSTAYEGFELAYRQVHPDFVCSRVIQTPDGVHLSPGYPGSYRPSLDCFITIKVLVGHQIDAFFPEFNLRPSSDCSIDSMSIHDGGSSENLLIGKYCGAYGSTNSPPHQNDEPIHSAMNTLLFHFVSDSSSDGLDTNPDSPNKFKLKWESELGTCGGTGTGTEGILSSPGWPSGYENNMDCLWIVTTNAGSAILFEFDDFFLETGTSHGCTRDWVQFFDGPTTTSFALTDRLCGTEGGDDPVRSNSSVVAIEMHSDMSNSNNERGFKLHWSTVRFNEISLALEGLIQSHNYPGHYPLQNTYWIVYFSPGFNIDISFNNFNLGGCDSSCPLEQNCDYLDIYTDYNKNDRKARFCGQTANAIEVQEEKGLVYFDFVPMRSDITQTGTGFELQYQPKGYFEKLNEESGTLQSLNFNSNGITENMAQFWQIQVPQNTTTGNMIEISMASGTYLGSSSTYVNLYIGSVMDEKNLLATWSRAGNSKLTSHTGEMLVVLMANEQRYTSGIKFKATYRSVPGICGGELHEHDGKIQSPGFPGLYPPKTECLWQIDLSPGSDSDKIIRFSWIAMDLEKTYSCPDYVEFFDGASIYDESLGKFCGTYEPDELPEGVMSTGPRALVKFKSDSSVEKTGFQLAYHDNCGGYHFANGTKQFLATPNYPSYYVAPAYCTWTIQASIPGERVLLHFDHFDTYFDHTEEGCKNAHYVQIFEGAAPDDVDIDKHCGISAPGPYHSKGSIVRVLFDATYDSGDNKRSGFTFDYSTEEDRCGGDWSGITGNIRYPPTDQIEADCTWNVFQSPGNPVELTLIFNTNNNPDCSRNYLWINATFDGVSEELIYCDKQQNASNWLVQYHYETYEIRYVSDGSLFGHSFEGTLVMNSGASKPFLSPAGQITSPLYPRLYPQRIDATWTLQAKSTSVIRYEISFFDVICTDRFMLINGELGSSPQFFDGCGDYLQENPEKAKGISSGNILTLRLVTNSEISGHGFFLNYTHVDGSGEIPVFPYPDPINQGECGNELVIAGMEWLPFISPGFPNGYQNNLDCFWYFKTTHNASILFNFEIIEIERDHDCRADFIKVYDGPTTANEATLLPCGNAENVTVKTTGADAIVHFHTNAAHTDPGFKAYYRQICGGVFKGSTGTIQSWNYPQAYNASDDICEYIIKLDPGVVAKLDFASPFGIDGDQKRNCTGDDDGYLELHNGYPDGPTFFPEGEWSHYDRYCGFYEAMPPFKSTTNTISLLFKAGPNNREYQGFKVSWRQPTLGCGEELEVTDALQTIESPSITETKTDCIWTLTVEPEHTIMLDFLRFDLKTDGKNDCFEAYVAIYDTLISHDDVFKLFCGSTKPPTTKTVGNVMKIVYHQSKAVRGWEANYTRNACGGYHTGTSGSISAEEPIRPIRVSDVNCENIIQSPDHHEVSIDFYGDFDVPCQKSGGSYLSGDFLEIVEWSDEGYFLIVDPLTQRVMAMDLETKDLVMRLPKADPDGIYDELWEWDHVYLRNVQLPSRGITIDSRADGPVAGDPLKVSKLMQLDTQKWMLSDGKLRLIDEEINLCIAAHPYEPALSMQPCDTAGVLTDFKQEHTKIGRSLGKFCGNQADMPEKTIKSRTPGVLVLHHIQAGHSGSAWNLNWTATPNNCAEELTEDAGTILSPKYPDPYESNKRCEWRITVNPRNSIILTFSDFDLKAPDDTYGCLNHYVQVYGGLYIDSPELTERLCGAALPMPVQSQGNTMKIVFDIGNDAAPNGRGFIADYNGQIAPKTCGSIGPVVLDEPTEISSPNYPNNYTDNSECIWTVQNTWVTGTIYYEFNDLEVEDGCVDKLDFYLVGPYDQPQLQAPQHTLCGKSNPKPFGIPGPVNDIRFSTNHNTNYKGFDMTVTEHSCGGIFGAVGVNWQVGGRMTSPNYPDNYDSDDYCIWYLVAPEGKILTYYFDTFDLDGATTPSECRDYDWLKVYEGIFQSREKHFWCSTNKPTIGEEMHSSQNMLKFIFKTDNRGERSGYAMQWNFSGNECGNQILQEQEGTISSPGYFSTPATNYPANMNCVWTINAEKNAHVELTFTDFWLQEPDNDLCLTDYVDVWNGKEVNTDRIGQYCGRRLPPPARSNLDHLVLNMISDGNLEYKGFAAKYEQVCGTLFVDEYIGYITNVGFGLGSYRPNTDCYWNITMSDKNSLIEARFLEFDVEDSPGCSSDFVAIYENEKAQENLVRKVCGSDRPSGFISARGSMIVNFVTNDKVEKSGFEMQFTVDECGGTYEGAFGRIANWHPDGFVGQHQNLDCIWLLRTEDTSYSVKVTSWIHFDLPVNVNCSSGTHGSYLAAFEGDSTQEADLIGRYCGKSPPRFLQSKSNSMTLRYKTDAEIPSAGFELKWAQTIGATYGCGGDIRVTTTATIQSPLYPAADYPDNLECVWNIYSEEPGISLKYEIKHFDLEPLEGFTGVCYDYVEIIDGASFQDRVMFGPACGEIGHQVVKGTHQQNVMIFVSDEVTGASGFEILVTAYVSQCGGELAVSDEYQNVNWNYMGDNSHCQWTLKTDKHHYISIETQTMSLPAPTDEYNLPISLRATENYQVLLDSLVARRVTRIDITADINKTVLFSLPFFLGLFDDYNQDPRFYIKFAVKLTQPDLYETTISNAQYEKLATVQHTVQDFYDLLDFIELRIEDHYIGVWNKDTGALFIEVDDSIENAFIDRKELTTLKVKTQEFPGTFTVTQVAYGVSGATQVFQLEPMQVSKGKKLGELERMYKTVSVELDVKLDARNDLDTWVNILQVTLNNDQGNSVDGDRMPLISLQPTSSQFHISWGLNGQSNYVTITDNQPLQKWIHLEITQSKISNGKYILDIKVDGRNYAGVVQEQPRDYVDMLVYASNPWSDAAHAEIRNLKITTQSDGSWEVFTGEDCREPCGGTGSCDFCGTVGFCCSGNTHNTNEGCTTDMLAAVAASGASGHVCVSYPQDSTCSDWSFKRETLCNCDDSGYDTHMVDKGVIECEMFCENDLRCIGFVYQEASNLCVLVDTITDDCSEMPGFLMGFLNRYECANNHNCDNSFVEFADINVQHGVGQRKRYCGSQKPPIFASLGSYATITTQHDGSGRNPTFTARVKGEVCNRVLEDSSGVILSHFGGGYYPKNLNCQIRIQGEQGSKMAVFFSFFDLECSDSCRNDKLVIGSRETYCCKELPEPHFYSGNYLQLDFTTDINEVVGEGFKADYTCNHAGCGGKVSGYNGYLYPFDWPRMYDSNQNCEWQIQSADDTAMYVKIKELNIFPNGTDKGSSCFDDEYLQIFEASPQDPHHKSMLKTCGTGSQPPVTIYARYGPNALATVVFKTGNRSRSGIEGNWNGFKINWYQKV